jgi:hypothetical protein
VPKVAYISKGFRDTSLEVIAQANEILREYAAQGYDLTLRQLYYQFVARGLIPNRQAEYDKLGTLISNARLAGLVDWYHITDRTRSLRGIAFATSPEDEVENLAQGYRTDKWAEQPVRVEAWIEKDALVGVIERPCRDLQIDYFSCRGYVSQSEMWRAGMRYVRYLEEGQRVVLLHLGDHDPSGLDMTRDIRERLELFAGAHHSDAYEGIEVRRIALNMDQVEQYDPPPNPAKLSDSRAWDYVREHGSESWELDALEPTVIGELITEAALAERDPEAWAASERTEAEERDYLSTVSDRWGEVVAYLKEQP